MELVIEFLAFFFNMMICLIIVSFIRGFFDRYEESLNEEVDELKEKIRKMIHFVKLEKHGDQLYWFDAQTDEFLGQGATVEEIIAHVQKRFPTHIFVDESANAFHKAPTWKPQPIGDLKSLKTVD